ncbi:unnamed protein product [Ilex paraguariensis]|uniref:Uncharacterized protein n=1 Tax=Ilex paraguariensis TaxID=185542 RepID=A0ABC8TN69_9AQUA
MEVRSENVQLRCDKLPGQVIPRIRLQVWFIRVCSSILIWTCVVQLLTVGELWHPHISNWFTGLARLTVHVEEVIASPPPLLLAIEKIAYLEVFGATTTAVVAGDNARNERKGKRKRGGGI